ncbi:MAG: MFS transporter [Gammaproteobacteria bacterium]
MTDNHQFQLLKSRRFAPFFWTQFLGAYNDNVYKNALIILIAYQTTGLSAEKINVLANVCAGVFTLPFFLFSATAGQMADKYEKAGLIRSIKLAEILVTFCACVGLVWHNVYFLIFVLFLFGMQSAFFGPVKYSILPQHLRVRELIGGNGMVEMGTFVAILVGTLIGGLLMANAHYGRLTTGMMVVIAAIMGWLFSLRIPRAKAVDSRIVINWNPITQTWRNLRYARSNQTLFYSIVGISWFWSFGGVFLAQTPNYVKEFLGGNAYIVTLLLTMFSIGIGTGSLLCERLSAQRIELGLVPWGVLGLVVFTLDFYSNQTVAHTGPLVNFVTFMSEWKHWHLMLDTLLMGMFGGFYIVPLYALIQYRSPANLRSRIIAANNIMNSFFMVCTATVALILLERGFTIPQLFLLAALMTLAVAILVFYKNPEFILHFMTWSTITFCYRVTVDKAIITLPQHHGCGVMLSITKLHQLLILMGALPRTPRFVVTPKAYQRWRFIFKTAHAIVANTSEEALHVIKEQWHKGSLLCLSSELLPDEFTVTQLPQHIQDTLYSLTLDPTHQLSPALSLSLLSK